MKFSAVLIASLVSASYGFAPSMQGNRASSALFADTKPRPVTTPATNIDKSLDGIDGESSTFDPTEGDNAALKRNNKDEVWVQQVKTCRGVGNCLCRFVVVTSFSPCTLLAPSSPAYIRELALVATASHLPCAPWFANRL